uniref:V-set domain containing T cell activation inhibitor 1 n=1 Tax=Apteryx owenii TaxID=8824 RepID=A0A8B9QD07_APTOW
GCTITLSFLFFPNSMTTVIIVLAAVIALIVGFGVSGKRSISVTTLPSPGNIGQNSILGCTFEPNVKLGSMAIRWAKAGLAGLVHEFRGGEDHLQEQDALFQGRMVVFADQVAGGNASLLLGSSVAVLQYRTRAFSTPEVRVEKSSSGDTLQCEAPRWFPRPMVHWTADSNSGKNLPQVANTSYELNSENVTLRVVSFLHNIMANTTYTCMIENNIAKATGDIKVTDFNITRGTNLQLLNLNIESVSSSLPACHWMLLLPLYLLSI